MGTTTRARTTTWNGQFTVKQLEELRAQHNTAESQRRAGLPDGAAAAPEPTVVARPRAVTEERVIAKPTGSPPPPPPYDPEKAWKRVISTLSNRVDVLAERAGEQVVKGNDFSDRLSSMTDVLSHQQESLDEYLRHTLGPLGELRALPADIRRLERTVALQSEQLGRVVDALAANTAARNRVAALGEWFRSILNDPKLMAGLALAAAVFFVTYGITYFRVAR